MRTVLSVSLPEQISSALDKFAKASGRNKSDIVKESISQYLWEFRYRDIRKKLSAKAKKTGIISEDDVYKAVS